MELEERTCSEGCGVKFKVLPTSLQRIARWDCDVICKGRKVTTKEMFHRTRVANAMSSPRRGGDFRGNLNGPTDAERRAKLAAEKAKEAEMQAVKLDPAIPQWRQDFDAVVKAANDRRDKRKSMDMPSVLDQAGVDQADWAKALKVAKKDCLEEAEALYETFGRKMHGPRKPKDETVAAEDDPPEETIAETPADEPASVGDVLANAYNWLVQLEGDERRRTFVALGLLLDIPEAKAIPAAAIECPPALKPRGKGRGR